MEMFLMVICMSLLGLGVSALAFGAATRPEEQPPQPQPQPEQGLEAFTFVAPGQFFSDAPTPPMPRPRVPIEVLLLQIDSHVRLEQAAAESFLESPSVALLHSRTASPLVH